MQLVNSPGQIGEGDYGALLEYSVVLESNYTRLKNIGFEHEISNSQAMTSILLDNGFSVEFWFSRPS